MTTANCARLGAMLELNTLLEGAGLDPARTIVARHKPYEPALNRSMRFIAAERPDLFRMYQQIQYVRLEKAMTRAEWLVAFLADGPGRAVFVTTYAIRGFRQIDYEEYWSMPLNQELKTHGMAGLAADAPAPLLFDLVDVHPLAEWKGRLVVRWPGLERSWWRWAARNVILVEAIAEDSRLARAMPDWDEIDLAWNELAVLPASWRAALSHWRGVYFIFDTGRQKGYVGSAYGAENILGRWLGYAATGHGGNVELRKSDPANLRFSILQRTSPDLGPEDVVRLEAKWKVRLHTREFGLNQN
jgi:hypothetical protein